MSPYDSCILGEIDHPVVSHWDPREHRQAEAVSLRGESCGKADESPAWQNITSILSKERSYDGVQHRPPPPSRMDEGKIFEQDRDDGTA